MLDLLQRQWKNNSCNDGWKSSMKDKKYVCAYRSITIKQFMSMFLLFMYLCFMYIVYTNLRIVRKLTLKHWASKKRNVFVSIFKLQTPKNKGRKSVMLMICIMSAWTCSRTGLIGWWCRLCFASSPNVMMLMPWGNFVECYTFLSTGCRC